MFRELLGHLSPLVSNKPVQTSGFVFRCLTIFTVNILVAAAFIVSMKQYFGNPIQCINDNGKFTSYMEVKCWVEGVFLDRSLFNYTYQEALSIGVGSPKFRGQWGERPDFIYHNYYQWVVPVLALEAMLLFMPRLLWRVWENGVMGKILKNSDSPTLTDEWNKQRDVIVKYFELKPRFHHMYAIKYIVCEIMAFIILIFNMHIMQWVFQNFWTEFKPAISSLMRQDIQGFVNYSARVFPHQAKCSLETVGASGSIQYHDGLCFLSQNNINEKVFVFLYFWFIAVAALGIVNMIGILVMLMFKFIRCQDIRRMTNCDHKRRSAEFCYWASDFGIWNSLRIVRRNLSPVLFDDLIATMMKYDGLKPFDYGSISEELEISGNEHNKDLTQP